MKEPLQYILSSFLSNMTGMKSWTGNRGRLKQCFSWKAYSVARMGHCQAAMLSFNWKVSAIDFQSFHPSFTFLLCRNILMKTKGDTETSTDLSLFCKCDFRESLFTFKIVYSTSVCCLLQKYPLKELFQIELGLHHQPSICKSKSSFLLTALQPSPKLLAMFLSCFHGLAPANPFIGVRWALFGMGCHLNEAIWWCPKLNNQSAWSTKDVVWRNAIGKLMGKSVKGGTCCIGEKPEREQ